MRYMHQNIYKKKLSPIHQTLSTTSPTRPQSFPLSPFPYRCHHHSSLFLFFSHSFCLSSTMPSSSLLLESCRTPSSMMSSCVACCRETTIAKPNLLRLYQHDITVNNHHEVALNSDVCVMLCEVGRDLDAESRSEIKCMV